MGLTKAKPMSVHVGLHPWERHPERPTRLVINIELFSALDRSLGSEVPEGIMDYDHIRTALKGWPGRAHTPLLETLLDELVGLCFQGQRVQACRVSIVKPDIFNEAGAAGVEVFMLRQDHGAAPSHN